MACAENRLHVDTRVLVNLPAPPVGKTGWPWTADSRRPEDLDRPGFSWPLVTIVTPSFNQGGFIEETIRSVLLQDYPNLEYLVIDGASTDDTVQTLKKYEPWLSQWVSEPDRGQTHAINKGFRRARGEIVAWLNSDDTYEPHAIRSVVRHMVSNRATIAYGNCRLIDEAGRAIRAVVPPAVTYNSLLWFWTRPASTPPQPAIFFRRHVLEEVGLLDEALHYVMDYELWLRISRKYSFSYVDALLANYRIHSDSKTVSANEGFARERYQVSERYGRSEGVGYHLSFWSSHARYRVLVWRARLWSAMKRRRWLQPLTAVISKFISSNAARPPRLTTGTQ